MRSWDFVFSVNPVPKGRPRFTKRGFAYTPAKTRNAEAELRWLMSEQWKNDPLEGPLYVRVGFSFLRPKSISEKKRPYPICKPDLTNCLKALEDAANKLLWRDDSQIVSMDVKKIYSSSPSIYLSVHELSA